MTAVDNNNRRQIYLGLFAIFYVVALGCAMVIPGHVLKVSLSLIAFMIGTVFYILGMRGIDVVDSYESGQAEARHHEYASNPAFGFMPHNIHHR